MYFHNKCGRKHKTPTVPFDGMGEPAKCPELGHKKDKREREK